MRRASSPAAAADVARRDLRRVLGAIAPHQRLLEPRHGGLVGQPGEGGLDEAVEVGADGAVLVRAGDLADALQVAADDLERVLERLGAAAAQPVGGLVLGQDYAHHSPAASDGRDLIRAEVVLLAPEAVANVGGDQRDLAGRVELVEQDQGVAQRVAVMCETSTSTRSRTHARTAARPSSARPTSGWGNSSR